eukprot:CAMPEP_0170378152 /NCGR_PEP_ID=MMETSP0117_2-20130122/12660_1 /TAXON_ID=400756 /ORGANISM="Durinskia baltica, Strain CSIRO CS-38" /LENGTH=582 /DNA_ID=CAMNT_0010633511 /DNA_START=63 /DNA_END=1811 /DNA_ORIENTATION=+
MKRTTRSGAVPSDSYVTGSTPDVKKSKLQNDISEYERTRLENIQRNEQFLASLGLNSLKATLKPSVPQKAPPKKKSVAIKKIQSDAPLRRSGRVTIEKLQDEVAQLQRNGDTAALETKQKELDEMVNKKNEGSYQVVQDSSYERREWKRLDAAPVPLGQLSYDPEKYNETQAKKDLNELVGDLKKVHNSSDGQIKKGKEVTQKYAPIEDYTASLRKLTICNAEVAKLTEDRITSVCFHPSADKMIVFAGDKSGNLGLWDVSRSEQSEIHGVYKYRPHVSCIARIHVSKFNPTAIHSTSYDGTVRLFDVEKECFSLCFQAPEPLGEMYFTEAEFLHDSANCMYVGSSDGSAALLDFRASSSEYAWKRPCESGYKLNSIQQHPSMPHLMLTSERTAVSLYDVRKGSSGSRAGLKALVTHVGHTHSVNAAHISPDGQYMVSVSQDHTIRTWRNFVSPAAEPDCVVTRHDNNTGRWLSTLRPTFDPKQGHAFILGSLLQPRRIEVFAPVTLDTPVGKATGKAKGKKEPTIASTSASANVEFSLNLLVNLEDDLLGSVCSRNAFHPTLNVVAGGNSSGRIHLFREQK